MLKAFINRIDIMKIYYMYEQYHTYNEQKIQDTLEQLYESRKSILSILRNKKNISQSDLAFFSNVNIKTIQSYELKQDNLQHAGYDNLVKLSYVLKCRPEDLLDQNFIENC
jgi:DNA-binding Xre family transcriptional regulator